MTKLKEVGTKKRKRGCLASSLISRAREREREKRNVMLFVNTRRIVFFLGVSSME